MYNAINRIIIPALLSLAVISCGDSDKESAAGLYGKSETALSNHQLSEALELLDTLDARYPKQIEVRREAMRLRASIMEAMAMDSIGAADAALAEATLQVQEWGPKFRHVDSSVGLEGYFLPAGVNEKVMMENGIQARVSDKGFFYIVANVQGKAIGLRSLELIDGSDRVTSAEISPARIIKVEGSESASFNPEELEVIGPWLEHHAPTQLILCGSKSDIKVKLSTAQAQELKDCYYYSRALQAQRRASIRREKFERMLATARDQLANFPAKKSE